jgi:hypothetical protein
VQTRLVSAPRRRTALTTSSSSPYLAQQKDSSSSSSRPGAPQSGRAAIEPLAPGTAALFDYSEYRRFTSRIGGAETTRPKERPIAWLMKYVEEIFDDRYAKDTQELKEGGAGGDGADAGAAAAAAAAGGVTTPFPTFVVEYFTKKFGLRSLIDQCCWDLLFNVHRLRKEHLEVEAFARFLEEMYDPDDLLFFLYVRSVVQKELNYSFRARWAEMGRNAAPSSPAKDGSGAGAASSGGALQLSFRDASMVSRVVFGSEADPLYKTFMTMIERHMSGKKGAKTDGRRIDVATFLHLAVVEYHETRPAEEGGSSAGAAGAGGDTERLFREAAAAYDDRVRTGGGGGGGGGAADGGSVGGGSSGRESGGPRPSPALLEAIGEAMHRANESYLDRAIAPASSLPKEVQAQIRTEVSSQLEAKVDNVLSATITVSQSGGSSGSADVDGLAVRFSALVAVGGGDDAIGSFCDAVLANAEVRKTVEPLVNLLVQYATSRLKEATGGK